jgi:predicted RNase H-like nuclease
LPSRGAPDLPYSVVAGVTPCAGGWLVASAKLLGVNINAEGPRVLTKFVEVLDERPTFSAVALNAPIGYLDEATKGGRTCDRLARALLGPRASTVRSAPIRASVDDEAEVAEDHVDAVTKLLLPRYHEVAMEMAPFRQRTVYQVHPELSFYQLNDDEPLRWPKRTQAGRAERRALLDHRFPGLEEILDADIGGATPSHLLDAVALVWTARRIFARAATRIPTDPEWDSQGLRTEFVF